MDDTHSTAKLWFCLSDCDVLIFLSSSTALLHPRKNEEGSTALYQKKPFYDILFSSNEEEHSFMKGEPKAFIYLDSEMKHRGQGG
ncbi:hypothetical protein CDAR_384941 [Caerostris darwini]|uniref:Uncharacterized protein n=1 Tax=Caerostris darwini TaxID=1538125 RepID=A0AAV4WAY1_9ARAC|nr:hypothetical protein CDAR_384941 [Caerostris darwini]